MQKERASQKERKKARDRDRKRTVYKTQQTKGGRNGIKEGVGKTGVNSRNRNNRTGEVRQERRENSAVISR